ncbi:MAG TPA: TonB family protein, partial [Blastocatellia bacterium]|nr:TonB family protein [Blastocatellia bacterium]
LSWWVYTHSPLHRRLSSEYSVKMLDLSKGPPVDFKLRLAPEPLSRVDLNHLQLDNQQDDTTLIPKSPNPGRRQGSGVESGSPRGSENKPSPAKTEVKSDASKLATGKAEPPGLQILQPGQLAPPEHRPESDLAVAHTDQPPAPPAEAHRGATTVRGERGEGTSNESELSFRSVESQYRAYVRAKIYNQNLRIMPRTWIETTLGSKVSADFSIVINPGGKLASLRMIRSSGYATLDDVARQAIVLASPFEGFPQTVAGAIEFPVTVTYTPYR